MKTGRKQSETMPPLPPGTASRMALSVQTMRRWVCSQPSGIPVVPPLYSRAASASRPSPIRSSGACSSSRSQSPTQASAARSSTPGEPPMEPGVGPGHHRHEDDGRAAGSGGCHLSRASRAGPAPQSTEGPPYGFAPSRIDRDVSEAALLPAVFASQLTFGKPAHLMPRPVTPAHLDALARNSRRGV